MKAATDIDQKASEVIFLKITRFLKYCERFVFAHSFSFGQSLNLVFSTGLDDQYCTFPTIISVLAIINFSALRIPTPHILGT
jgi:hypothetical protein